MILLELKISMEENKSAIIVSGYFNPLHIGHIEYFHNAKEYADILIVIVNNDEQRKLKGSKEFMNENERLKIIKELRVVDEAFLSIDKSRDVSKSIEKIHNQFSNQLNLFFGNGGDQNNSLIPEAKICNKLNIKLIDGLGIKIQSSSWLLKMK
ncbi:MAG: adenylyltransferase/cytidyltransferase family protein [Candidatus Marinimicrobia bacterium]|nr:adenylyltransferase/cytidyltransferase family protein [Candidatus Neomarinimicrobiota bacterium]